MTNKEKFLIEKVNELDSMVVMLLNKINAIHELSSIDPDVGKAFKAIEKSFSLMPDDGGEQLKTRGQ